MMKYTKISLVRETIPKRPDDAHKGTMGSLLSICGSYGMAGAAMLAAKAALRTGVGLQKSALPQSIYPIAATAIWESVYLPLCETEKGAVSAVNLPYLLEQAKTSQAVLLGCGLGQSEDVQKIVFSFLENCETPMVLDADALNVLAGNLSLLRNAKAPVIITPHPAEFGRLAGVTTYAVNADRENYAAAFAQENGVVTVLKGAGTVIASPDGRLLVNPTGNSGMATGGSGDVLAGMTGSLVAQGAPLFEAAASAVYLHGLAGDIAAQRLGKVSLLPSDIIETIPAAFLRCGVTY